VLILTQEFNINTPFNPDQQVENRIKADEFLRQALMLSVIDVRSEKEYLQGHIPGAFNIPLFNNEERAIVGTIYKFSGREASVLKGLELAGVKLAAYVKHLQKITDRKQILLHCWRGGMRSESMAWLFEQAGFKVAVLEGGYKSYRRYIREQLSGPADIVILGGLTGSGKTELLHLLEQRKQQVLDLEKLACHKGSVFGGLGQPDQPTNEQFENDIYEVWKHFDPSGPVWIEDESRMIGSVSIPDPLFDQMNHAPMIELQLGTEVRIRRLMAEYSTFAVSDLREAVLKISEKLGGARTKRALAALDAGDLSVVAQLSLSYYDKAYTHAVQNRKNKQILSIGVREDKPEENAGRILEAIKSVQSINSH
jgi:tRNA 2-selenouridine synthase